VKGERSLGDISLAGLLRIQVFFRAFLDSSGDNLAKCIPILMPARLNLLMSLLDLLLDHPPRVDWRWLSDWSLDFASECWLLV
jgi:hypothetical protein